MNSKQISFEKKGLESLDEDLPTDIQKLNLSQNQLTDITVSFSHQQPVLKLSMLNTLNVSNNQISEIPALSCLPKLKILNISHNSIESIQLGAMPSLCVLLANDNKLGQISGLSRCPLINVLILSRNKITKIEGLEHLPHLGKLTLSGNLISKLENLSHLKQLKQLRLNENQLKTLSGSCADQMESLLLVDLGNNQIPSFKEFKSLQSNKLLRDLNIKGNPGSFDQDAEPQKTSQLMAWFPNLVIYNSAHAKSKPKRGLSKVTAPKQRSKFMSRIEKKKLQQQAESAKQQQPPTPKKVQRKITREETPKRSKERNEKPVIKKNPVKQIKREEKLTRKALSKQKLQETPKVEQWDDSEEGEA